jgi:hypothetical protein
MYIAILTIFAVTAAAVAHDGGRPPGLWFLIGLALGPFSLFVVLLPPIAKPLRRPARRLWFR